MTDETAVMVVTGASRGVGRFLTKYYAAAGYRVVASSRQRPEDLPEGCVQFIEADVRDEQQVKRLFATVRREYGRLDALINNAGVAAMNHALLTPKSTVSKILDTNVTGTFLCAREAAKIMQRARFGRIVNFASVAVPLRLAGEAIYASSKAAVINLTEVLAHELGQLGITVNCVAPNPIKTDLLRGVAMEKLDQVIGRQAIRRYGTFDDVANVIDFFLKHESDFVTGQTVFLGGISK